MTTGTRLKKPSRLWLITKAIANTTTIAILSIWLGYHYGYQSGFHRGVIVTTELVELFSRDKDKKEDKIQIPQFSIAGMRN